MIFPSPVIKALSTLFVDLTVLLQRPDVNKSVVYVVGSKSFWPDIQKPRQVENAVRDI